MPWGGGVLWPLTAAPCSDCMIGKDVPLRDMVTTLQLAFHHHAQLPPTAPAATPPKVTGPGWAGPSACIYAPLQLF